MGFLTSSLANPPKATPQTQQQPPLGFAQAVQGRSGSGMSAMPPVQHFDGGGSVFDGSDTRTGPDGKIISSTSIPNNMGLGPSSPPPAPNNPLVATGDVGAGMTAANPLRGQGTILSGQPVTDSVGSMIGGIGDLSKSIGGAFTTQNQFQAQLAPTQQLDYTGIIGQAGNNALQGYGQFGQNQQAQQGVANQLQSLAGQYGQQALGQGPNPAQAALAQNTGNNVAQQAALMAGQRGASANAGMIARQAAQQGAATQQQGVGQAATLQAQQQLAAQQGQAGALQQLGGLYGQMGNQNIAQQQTSASLFGTGTGANNTQNANTIQNYANAQGLNQKTAQGNADAANKTTGGLLQGAGSLLSMLAKGGTVPKPASGPQSRFAHYCKGGALNGETYAAQGMKVPGRAAVAGNSYANDKVPAMLSPGEIIVPRDHANDPQKAAQFAYAVAMKNQRGGK